MGSRYAWQPVLSRAGIAIAAALTLALGGCVVGPDFEVPAPPATTAYLPGAASAHRAPGITLEPGGRVRGDWWEILGSKKLDELIAAGLLHNADLAAADAAIRVAQANMLALRGGFFPTVQAKWETNRQVTPTRTLQSNHADDKAVYTLHTPQVTVAYVADVFGGLRRQVEALDAQTEAQAMQREAVALTLTANIALAAILQASFEGQIDVTTRLIDAQSRLLDILRRQQSAGQIALPDVLVQETAVAQARLLLPPLQRQRDQQRNVLAVLTGRLPSELPLQSFRLAEFRMPRQLPVSVPADLMRQRPDIRIAEANLRQANAQIGAAIAARLPQITLTGNGGSTADAVGKLFSPGTWFGMIAGSALQTVFDGRTLAMKQQAAEAAFEQQTAQYRSVALTAFQNVADVLLAIEADAKSLVAARAAEAAANRSLTLVRAQVDQGQVSLPTLLAAQQAFLQTSLARVQAEAARLTSAVALYQALGGGWWNRNPPEHPVHKDHHHHVAKVAAQ